MIQTIGLKKSFGSFEALRGLDVEVPAGCVYGFLGPNGAGKTTTIRMLTGLLKPTSGRILVCGVDLGREPRRAKALMGYVPDRPELPGELSARELLRLVAGLHGLDRQDAQRATGLLEAFELAPFADEAIGGFSHGMRQKLALACALLPRPKVLILDEPMVGLDPQGSRQVKDLLRRLAARGLTVFLSIHSLEIAETLCDRIAILADGALVSEGTPDELKVRFGEAGLERAFLRLTGAERGVADDLLFGDRRA